MARKPQNHERSAIDPNSAVPVYQQLVKILTQEILSGRLPAGTKLPERWMAEEYRVARPTVRNTLHKLVAQGLVHRISPRRIVVADVQVDQGRLPAVPIILVRDRRYPWLDASVPDSWYGEIRAGIRVAAKEIGCSMHEEALADPIKVPLKEYVAPRPDEIGGVVLCGTYDEQYIEMFRSERIPLVLVDYWTHNLMVDCVCVDVEAEAYAIIDLLVSKGHSSLGFVATGRSGRGGGTPSYEYDPDVHRMLDHLQRACRHRHVELRDEWCQLVPYEHRLPEAVHHYLSMRRRPTAFLCFSPIVAETVLQTATRVGLRCPEDFSLVVHGAGHAGERPAAGTVIDPRLLGRAAVKLLAERMHGLRSHAVKQALSPRLVMGTTVGPAPASSSSSRSSRLAP